MNTFILHNITLQFGSKKVLDSVDWIIEKGTIATLIGPNGCGKSTLLRVLTSNYNHFTGKVDYEGRDVTSYSPKEMAKQLAFLPQSPELPKDIVVEELVYCGRFPYQAWWKNTATEDRCAVEDALRATKTLHLKDRVVSSLSGGERQRVWIAMALAQEPNVLVLDEPTTYLDINHQIEILELIKKLNQEKGITVIMVLHELNQAATYSQQVAVLHEGKIAHAGKPSEVMTQDILEKVFSVQVEITVEDSIPYIKIKGLL